MKKLFLLVLFLILVPIMGTVEAGPGLCRATSTSLTWANLKDVPCSVTLDGSTRAVLNSEDVAVGVIKNESRFAYTNIVLAAPTTTVVKSGAGLLHVITVNKSTALGVIQCFDNTSASGNIIATITQPAAVLQSQIVLWYDTTFSLGLTCVTSIAAQDITVSSR